LASSPFWPVIRSSYNIIYRISIKWFFKLHLCTVPSVCAMLVIKTYEKLISMIFS
jgi:hypothetical protein